MSQSKHLQLAQYESKEQAKEKLEQIILFQPHSVDQFATILHANCSPNASEPHEDRADILYLAGGNSVGKSVAVTTLAEAHYSHNLNAKNCDQIYLYFSAPDFSGNELRKMFTRIKKAFRNAHDEEWIIIYFDEVDTKSAYARFWKQIQPLIDFKIVGGKYHRRTLLIFATNDGFNNVKITHEHRHDYMVQNDTWNKIICSVTECVKQLIPTRVKDRLPETIIFFPYSEIQLQVLIDRYILTPWKQLIESRKKKDILIQFDPSCAQSLVNYMNMKQLKTIRRLDGTLFMEFRSYTANIRGSSVVLSFDASKGAFNILTQTPYTPLTTIVADSGTYPSATSMCMHNPQSVVATPPFSLRLLHHAQLRYIEPCCDIQDAVSIVDALTICGVVIEDTSKIKLNYETCILPMLDEMKLPDFQKVVTHDNTWFIHPHCIVVQLCSLHASKVVDVATENKKTSQLIEWLLGPAGCDSYINFFTSFKQTLITRNIWPFDESWIPNSQHPKHSSSTWSTICTPWHKSQMSRGSYHTRVNRLVQREAVTESPTKKQKVVHDNHDIDDILDLSLLEMLGESVRTTCRQIFRNISRDDDNKILHLVVTKYLLMFFCDTGPKSYIPRDMIYQIECKNVFLDEPSNQILFHVTIWYWEHAWGFMKSNQRYTFHVYQNSDVSSSIETLATMLFQLCTECGWSQNHILHRHVVINCGDYEGSEMLVTKAAEEEREQAVINCGDYEGSEMLVTKTAEEEQKVQQLELYLEQANLAIEADYILHHRLTALFEHQKLKDSPHSTSNTYEQSCMSLLEKDTIDSDSDTKQNIKVEHHSKVKQEPGTKLASGFVFSGPFKIEQVIHSGVMIVLTTEVESLKVRLYYKYYTTENKKVATQKFKNFARWVKARPLILTGSIDWTNDVCRTQLFEAITSYNVDGKTLLKPDCNISEEK